MSRATPGSSIWSRYARQWRFLRAPLSPCAEDIARREQAIGRHFPGRKSLSALLLGVTPRLATKRWKPALDIVAVDNTMAMIQSVWPGNNPRRRVICGDWLQLPFPDASIDVALIDGGLPALSFPRAHALLAKELRRVLKTDGLFVARIFARPDDTEQLDAVLTAARERRIGGFHAFKWRLAMSLQGEDAACGIRLDDIWRCCNVNFGEHTQLQRIADWPIEEIRTIDAYRGNVASYHFPSVDEMIDCLAGDLSCVERMHGTYELAERCPILIFRRNPAP
jgi:SAM-dependent methyltransferase